jgi:hypothetical protein
VLVVATPPSLNARMGLPAMRPSHGAACHASIAWTTPSCHHLSFTLARCPPAQSLHTCADYMQHVLLPTLRQRLGLAVEMKLQRRGFYPKVSLFRWAHGWKRGGGGEGKTHISLHLHADWQNSVPLGPCISCIHPNYVSVSRSPALSWAGLCCALL